MQLRGAPEQGAGRFFPSWRPSPSTVECSRAMRRCARFRVEGRLIADGLDHMRFPANEKKVFLSCVCLIHTYRTRVLTDRYYDILMWERHDILIYTPSTSIAPYKFLDVYMIIQVSYKYADRITQQAMLWENSFIVCDFLLLRSCAMSHSPWQSVQVILKLPSQCPRHNHKFRIFFSFEWFLT